MNVMFRQSASGLKLIQWLAFFFYPVSECMSHNLLYQNVITRRKLMQIRQFMFSDDIALSCNIHTSFLRLSLPCSVFQGIVKYGNHVKLELIFSVRSMSCSSWCMLFRSFSLLSCGLHSGKISMSWQTKKLKAIGTPAIVAAAAVCTMWKGIWIS